MNFTLPTELHPWPPLLALVMELDSTEVVSLIDSTGLVVNWALSGNDDYSNKTRKRAYRPRLDAAFRALDDSSQLRVAWILTRELLQRHPEHEEPLRSKLAEIGWRVDAGKLVPGTGPVRELLLAQGTEYDSYRAIKLVIQEAKQSIAVVDPYLDGTIFTMLATSASPTLSVKLLTSRVPVDFALEGGKFRKQFPQFIIEARKTSDFHDRFIIIDDSRCWHVGASIKDAGGKTFMISEVEDGVNRDALKNAFIHSWGNASNLTIP
jgi:hypothetical protein